MKFDIKDIADAIGAKGVFTPGVIDTLLIDSRLVTTPATSLFIALRTPNNDGHFYINQLLAKGIRNFIVSSMPSTIPQGTDANFLVVSDTLKALQAIGSMCRSAIKGKVIGITGSRGKTIVKEWIYQSLGGICNVGRGPRSYNSQIGVPLSLWQIDPQCDVAVIEAGISQSGEMDRLAEMIRCDIGILTDITGQHSEGFGSTAEKISEKAGLFKNASAIIYDSGNTLARDILQEKYGDRRLIGVTADASDMSANRAYVKGAVRLLCEEGIVSLPRAVSEWVDSHTYPVDTRLNVIDGVNNCRLIFDRFTADTSSLRGAMDFMQRQVRGDANRTLILATDGFAGADSEIDRIAESYRIGRIITVGKRRPALDNESIHQHIPSPDLLSTDDFYNEAIMIKGSNELSLEPLYRILEAKQHETLLEVNLDAMVHNFNFFRSKVKPTTGVICMLKAHGYGAGSVELARTLQSQGAAYIAVAVVDEGVELRQAGITMPILALNPRAQNYKVMFDNRLEPEIYSFEMLDEIIRSAKRYGVAGYPVHIKLDTGMRRLGFIEEDMDELAERIISSPQVRVETVFSHLATADDPSEDDYTRSQFDYFDRCYRRLTAILPYLPKRHILNSTGIVRFPEYQFDYVRLGIGLYGIPTLSDGSMADLRPVSTLTTPIISIKHWKEGDTVGYNRRGKLTRDSVIATIPIGYADGLDRHLGYGNADMLVNGHRAPTVGSICMDICMIDVTGIDCRVGDRVEVFGNGIAAQELADKLTTIPYEILTSISPRVKRVYYRE